jgi:hypothetical protein
MQTACNFAIRLTVIAMLAFLMKTAGLAQMTQDSNHSHTQQEDSHFTTFRTSAGPDWHTVAQCRNRT